ncbi:calcium/calmodulin dependent protein kinase [Leptodontidium sp. 2 PMI_412]|nr:calcium/calmodulin dependent protein kinase [Leptodontidium sp. 2 PMI_412]
MATAPFSPGTTLRGQSGRTYTIQEVLAERREPLLCVYRASNDDDALLISKSAEGRSFIVKNMIPGEYEYQQALQRPLASCPNLRTVVDGLPGPELFIYPFLQTDFLQFIPHILTTLANIKPNNILLGYEEAGDEFTVKDVKISDLEDAVILPPGKYLREGMCGNQMWRSPEFWARSAQGTPSDIFSFGLVSIYVMLNDIVLRASDEELTAADSWRYVLRRQISFFADEEGFKGLLQWIGEKNQFFERLIALAGSFDAVDPRKPFEKWHCVDAQFRDLVCKMTNLDPARRITAVEALRHPWFANENEKSI